MKHINLYLFSSCSKMYYEFESYRPIDFRLIEIIWNLKGIA